MLNRDFAQTLPSLDVSFCLQPCPAGRYCPNSKMTAGTLCPAGTFNRNVGQTLATACVKCPVNVSVQGVPVCSSMAWHGLHACGCSMLRSPTRRAHHI